jgi:hypothetical protein
VLGPPPPPPPPHTHTHMVHKRAHHATTLAFSHVSSPPSRRSFPPIHHLALVRFFHSHHHCIILKRACAHHPIRTGFTHVASHTHTISKSVTARRQTQRTLTPSWQCPFQERTRGRGIWSLILRLQRCLPIPITCAAEPIPTT